MTQKSLRYRIIKTYDSDGDAHFYAQKNIFGIWIGCRWIETSYCGTHSSFLETVEAYIKYKLTPEEKRKNEVVRIYD